MPVKRGWRRSTRGSRGSVWVAECRVKGMLDIVLHASCYMRTMV